MPAAAPGHPRCPSCKAPLPWLVDAGDQDFAAIAEQSPLPVLVDLWAPWCGPCRVVGPIVERLATSHAGRLKVVKVNVDQAPGVSAKFRVQGIPTMLVMKEGAVVDQIVGALPAHALEARVAAAAGL